MPAAVWASQKIHQNTQCHNQRHSNFKPGNLSNDKLLSSFHHLKMLLSLNLEIFLPAVLWTQKLDF